MKEKPPPRKATQARRRSAKPSPRGDVEHPHSVPILEAENLLDPEADSPFAEGVHDEIDPDLRYRLISEAAYARYAERGYRDGSELEDWLEAEGDIEHILGQRQQPPPEPKD